MLSASATRARCVPAPAFVTDERAVPLQVRSARAGTPVPDGAASAVDGGVQSGWSAGWRFTSEAHDARLELALSKPTRLESIHLVVRGTRGSSAVRTRILGLSASGSWLAVSSGGQAGDSACARERVYDLPETAPPLSALRFEFQSEALRSPMELQEVWAIERR
jgi:hypothetical protein